MTETLDILIRDSVGLGVLVLVLIGFYRLLDKLLSIFQIGIEQFLKDFSRIADGIADIAHNYAPRKD